MLYNSNRKASKLFQKIGVDTEEFLFNSRFALPMKQVIQLKTKMKLTVKQYKMMRNCLSDYLSLPGYANLSKEIRKLMPILKDPYDFMINGEIVGKYWPLHSIIKDSVLDVLETHHGENPDRVEKELFIKGGFGGDGFSGCIERNGRDIDKNITSRYFVGMKIARIEGKRKFDQSFTGPTEYFVETSQAFNTVKPILIGHFKENNKNLHDVDMGARTMANDERIYNTIPWP